MSYFNRVRSLNSHRPVVCAVLALALCVMAMPTHGQTPGLPDKQQPQATIPSKTTPLASPQVQASPQQAYAEPEQAPVVLRAIPRSYAVSRVIVQAAPVQYHQTVLADVAPQVCQVALADPGVGCGVQNQVVVQRAPVAQRVVVNHGVQQVVVDHGAIAAQVGRQPKKIKTKQVTKVKRGLFGR